MDRSIQEVKRLQEVPVVYKDASCGALKRNIFWNIHGLTLHQDKRRKQTAAQDELRTRDGEPHWRHRQ